MKAHLSLLAATLLFGFNYWIAKGLMPTFFSPMQIVFMRIIISFFLYLLLHFTYKRTKIEQKDLFRLFICGVLGVSFNQIMFFEGLNYSTPGNVSLLHVLNPVLVVVFAVFIIKEKINFVKGTGILLGAAGAAFLVVYDSFISFSNDTLKGNIFIIINLTSYSLYLVLIKPLLNKYNPVTVMMWIFFFGLLTSFPITVNYMHDIDFSLIPTSALVSLAYVIFATTFLAYLLISYSLKRLEASVVSYYTYLQPVIVSTIGIMLHKEGLNMTKIISAALIFTGVYLVSKKSRIIKN
ncbi:MAG: EamA family transporter [Bacteroidales bacterium]|nr:EamA family transporter [Bacteroidales bacterium]